MALELQYFVERIALKTTAECSQNAQGHGSRVPCSVHISSEVCRWEKLHMPICQTFLFLHTRRNWKDICQFKVSFSYFKQLRTLCNSFLPQTIIPPQKNCSIWRNRQKSCSFIYHYEGLLQHILVWIPPLIYFIFSVHTVSTQTPFLLHSCSMPLRQIR